MSRIARVVIGIFAAVGFAYAALLAFVSVGPLRGSSMCVVYPVMEVHSPEFSYLAKMENSSCDGGELQTKVYLSGDKKILADGMSASVFEAASARRPEPGVYAPLQLRLSWTSESNLSIRYPRGTHFDSRVDNVDGVRISYVETDSFAP